MKTVSSLEKIKNSLLNAKKIVQESSVLTKKAASADNKDLELKNKSDQDLIVLQALEHSIVIVDDLINATIKDKAINSKGKIKVISNRRLMIGGLILEYKQIAEIPNNDEAKRCLKTGLITMI